MLAFLSSLLRSSEGHRWSCTAYWGQPGGVRFFPGNLGQPSTCPCAKKCRSQTCSADSTLLRLRLKEDVPSAEELKAIFQLQRIRPAVLSWPRWRLGLHVSISLTVSAWLNLEPAEHLQSRMVVWQLGGHVVHGGASDVTCMMNMKAHLPYVSTDIVIQLCLSYWLTLSAGKLSWTLLERDQLRYLVF